MLQNIVGRNVRKVTGSDDTPKAKYVYTGDGVKQSVTDGANGYDYLGSLTYRRTGNNLSLDQAVFDGGVLLPGGTVDYFVKDHLGSVRVIVDQTGAVQEQNDYYPYGERYANGTYAVSSVSRFKYNGKEEQTTGDLDMLDYGARMYDSKIGRWFVPDPLAEKYYSVSPYAYCNNNPLRYIDSDGRKIIPAPNSSPEFMVRYERTVEYMKQKGTAAGWELVNASAEEYIIMEGSAGFNYKTNTIFWDPYQLVRTDKDVILYPATVLAHELGHVVQKEMKTQEQFLKDMTTKDSQYGSKLERENIVNVEQNVALKHGDIKNGEMTRENHEGTIIEITTQLPENKIMEDYKGDDKLTTKLKNIKINELK